MMGFLDDRIGGDCFTGGFGSGRNGADFSEIVRRGTSET